MLPISLRNKIEIMRSENQEHETEAGNIVLGFRKRGIGMHRKAYFPKELNYTIPYHFG